MPAQSDRAARWQQDLQRARGDVARASSELQRLELLGGQTVAAAQRGERGRQVAAIRGKASQLKVELERLQRELEGLSATSGELEVTRKSVTQYRDDLSEALAELAELQRRCKGGATNGQSWPVAASAPGAASSAASTPAGSFVRLAGEPATPGTGGAELQPVSQRSLLQQQQQMMRDFDEPLSALEGTVNNLQQVGNMIRSEITLQNRMLDTTNEATERVASRMGRVRGMLERFTRTDRNRCLMCSVFILLMALIVILVLVVTM